MGSSSPRNPVRSTNAALCTDYHVCNDYFGNVLLNLIRAQHINHVCITEMLSLAGNGSLELVLAAQEQTGKFTRVQMVQLVFSGRISLHQLLSIYREAAVAWTDAVSGIRSTCTDTDMGTKPLL